MGIGFVPLYFANSLISAVLASVLLGFGFAGVISSMDLIGARIIDEDSDQSGKRREAIFISASGFMNRLNGLFTSLAFFLVFKFYGFESGDVPGTDPGGAAKFLLSIFPFVLICISCVFSRFLSFAKKIKEEQPQD